MSKPRQPSRKPEVLPRNPSTSWQSHSITPIDDYADSAYHSNPSSLRSFRLLDSASGPSHSQSQWQLPQSLSHGGPSLSQTQTIPLNAPSTGFPPIPSFLQAQADAIDTAPASELDELDSAYDGESLVGDDTNTLASYITDHRYENGRRYHAYRDEACAYWGPNDEHAAEIVNLAHYMYLITLDNQLHLAPIVEPHRILDVGTGTGIWAIGIADKFPSAAVLGTDLSPIQPDMVPPNCEFEIDDMTLEWTFPVDHFDFIHVREMFGSIPDWDYFLKQAYRHTIPGGWVEIVEHSVEPISDDQTIGPDHFLTFWGKVVIEMGEKSGKTFHIWKEAKQRMECAGFVDVVEVEYKWPINGWPCDPKLKELGKWNQLRMHDGVESFMLRLLTTVGGWTYERAQLHLAEMR